MLMNAVCPSRLIFLFVLTLQISGCASPSQRIDEQAAALGYQRLVVLGDGYEHVVYLKEGRAAAGSALHVYLVGDGAPWLRRGLAASDPTPRRALMFELMGLDPAPSLYLGRPCYHGLSKSPACTPGLWTDSRYSEAVVTSMASALDRVAAEHRTLILLGYSGGGTLAMLTAERLPQTSAVVTVAANLDTARWTELHGQQALSGSLDPARRPPLPGHVKQLHIAGELDDNVPPELIRDAIAHQPGALYEVLPGQDHSCCWREVWPAVLADLDRL